MTLTQPNLTGEFKPTSLGRLTPYLQRENHNTFFTSETKDLRSSRVIMVPTSREKELPLDRTKTSPEKSWIETSHRENSEKRRNESKLVRGCQSHEPNTVNHPE